MMMGCIEMDEQTKKMIDYYLPNPPDPDLGQNEFYYLQEGMKSRIIKVLALDILPVRDGVEYGLYTQKGSRLVKVDTGYGNPFKGSRMCDLYDNKTDCRNREHNTCDDWQRLRKIQKEEGLL